MNNYTALNEKILEELTDFTANISKGLGKVDTRFFDTCKPIKQYF